MFKVDFIDGDAITWRKTENGVEAEKHRNYYPTFYIGGDRSELKKSRPWISDRRHVVATRFEKWRPTLSKEETNVLRVDVRSEEKLMDVVKDLKKNFSRSRFRFYNVGLSQQFRFCLQNRIEPTPEKELEQIDLSLHRKHLADEDISRLQIDGEEVEGGEEETLDSLGELLRDRDPDIMIVNRGQVLKLLRKKIDDHGADISLGRLPTFQEVAGENTVSSYGKTLHSSARYNVPGRIVIDRSNSFLLGEATLEGLWDLVERSYRPMQELAWGSIGRVLTSIEVRKAYLEENTLTPWKNWSGEDPKKASKMHKADRGGFIFNPEPGIHENVYEADFASLFPNIMVKKNISPETVNCDCCDNRKVPELDYTICEKKRGFIPKVLKPLVEDRQEMKEEIEHVEDEKRRRLLQGSIDAIKWLLVSCFGYMGHAHASYGAIECHQAIQAYDREIMIQAKKMFEENGYEIVHGIVDSIWITPGRDAEPIQEVCDEISRAIGIELEFEHRFDWVGFVPRSGSEADISTLNRYFGKKRSGGFKLAGIETEQSSTCRFVKDRQEEMIEAFDGERSPEEAIAVLRDGIERLESGDVPVEELVIQKNTSKSLEDYNVENRNVAALKRAELHGINIRPGQSIRYVVRQDNAPSRERVRLAFEAEEYDARFYREQLIRACETVLSTKGLEKDDIKERLEGKNQTLRQAID